ncbi:MAG: lipoyl(octanoyl) transferase LipB [Bacteroidales bacterium]|nr:lipoyl(octanoyl) transferase LipB [Bacteroidales bacterium]
MKTETIYKDLGLIDYKEAWALQEEYFNILVENKKKTEVGDLPNYLIFCEHPNVYTLGKSGKDNNLLISESFLKSISATYYKTNRGGDITYHGPGQLVGYPIFDIEKLKLSIKEYVYLLEQCIINLLAKYNLKADRLQGATGVWLDSETNNPRKICAIGVKAGRYITMHGFALNINTNLSYFNHINPCGFTDKGVSSMQKELGKEINLNKVKTELLKEFEEIFNLKFIF